MVEVENVFKNAIHALEKAAFSYVFVGGVTAIHHGSSRTTEDIHLYYIWNYIRI